MQGSVGILRGTHRSAGLDASKGRPYLCNTQSTGCAPEPDELLWQSLLGLFMQRHDRKVGIPTAIPVSTTAETSLAVAEEHLGGVDRVRQATQAQA